MPTLDEPSHDPDGQRLMASLRARIARFSGARPPMEHPLADQYRPALTALQGLLQKRTSLGAPESEMRKLRGIAAALQDVLRGL